MTTQSAAFDGLRIVSDLTGNNAKPGVGIFTNSGYSCPPPPADPAQTSYAADVKGSSAPAAIDPIPTDAESPDARFENPAAHFGDRKLTLEATVRNRLTDGSVTVTAKFTIAFFRCSNGADPRGC